MIFSNFQQQQSVLPQKEQGSPYLTDYEMSNSCSVYTSSNGRQTQVRKRRKTTQYGGKDRNSVIYKFMKERQVVLNNYKPRAQMSLFTSEEDQILIMLVKKIGPKFSKISKYFPGKTVNMVKNRYYKSLRSQAPVSDDHIQSETSLDQMKPRIIGRKILESLPEGKAINLLVEESPLFPEAKRMLNSFVTEFERVIAQCHQL